MKIQKIILGLLFCGFASLNAYAQGSDLANPELDRRISALEKILQYVTVVEGEINGVAGPHFIIEGANVHVRSGAGSTGEGCSAGNATTCPPHLRTGLGNLIIGYNEPRPSGWDPDGLCASNPDAQDPVNGRSICTRRDGAHHLVVGQGNNFVGHGGAVMGLFNEAKGSHTTVTGGRENSASGPYSSVAGGQNNVASGFVSSVGAGLSNIASGEHSAVSAGIFSEASGPGSAVSGGHQNKAIGGHSSVSGGEFNEANNFASSVSGGAFNHADGELSSVSGGKDNIAGGLASSVSGGINSTASGFVSAVSGGDSHTVNGAGSSISGGTTRTANADFCTVGDSAPDC